MPGQPGQRYGMDKPGMPGERYGIDKPEERPTGHPEQVPLLEKRLLRPATIFFPGHRIRMNIVPMFLNIFLPWMVFIICCGLTGFWAMNRTPKIVYGVVLNLFVLWVFLSAWAIRERRRNPEPTWFTYIAIMHGIALCSGVFCGRTIYNTLSGPAYEIDSLKVIRNLDAGRERGQDLMDAGIAYFAEGNYLDQMKSWHFKHRTLYCVAPIVQGGDNPTPLSHSYDFWVVGQDCCSTTSSDFRCGQWRNPRARSGIRVLDSHELMNYRLAVQQAETLYGIVSTHPIFFTWMEDPLAEVESWNVQAFKNYVFLVCLAFCICLTCLALATCKFAWIGRASSHFDMDFYNDPGWRKAGEPRPAQGLARRYDATA